MSSPRLQHTTGGGLNSLRASKPVLFANKMQLWVNHRLSPTCWHMHPHTHRKHMPWHGGIGSSTRFMPNSHHLLFCEPLKHLNESGPMFTLSGWLMQTVSVRNVRYRLVQPFRVFDQVRAVLLKWRLSLWNTWMCESCSSPVQPRVHPSTDRIQFLNYWQWR